MRCTVSQNRFENHSSASCRAARICASRVALAGCFGLVLAVSGCGGKRPPTFGELTGQPPAEEVQEAARPVREQEPDHTPDPVEAEPEKPKTLADLMALVVPGNKDTSDTRVQALIKHPEAALNIVDLDLHDTPVTDKGLEGVETLTSLVNVDVRGTAASGSTLMKLKRMPSLRTLRIGGTEARFPVPPFVEPTEFPELKELTCTSVPIKGDSASFVRQLKGLTKLSLSQCSVSDADLACIRPLADLEDLDISRNPITDEGLVFLLGHPRLRSLNISFTNIQGQGMAALVKSGELQELTSLSVGNLKLGDAFAEALVKLSKLEHLDLGQTTCTDKGLTLLRSFKGLKSLGLVECPGIVGPGLPILRELPELERLSLDLNPQINDQHLAVFATMKQLKYLGLTRTDCSELGAAKLREFLPECEIAVGGSDQ